MKIKNIVIGLIVLAVASFAIFFREPLRLIFSSSAESEAQKVYEEAKSELEKTQESAKEAKEKLAELDLKVKSLEAKVEESKANLENPVDEDGGEGEEAAKFQVEVREIEAQPIESGLALSGKIEAGRKISVTAEASGKVISEPLKSGKPVIKGDVLCEIDPGTIGAQLAQAEAAFSSARSQYSVQRELNARGLASDTAVEMAFAQFEQAQAAVEQARSQVKNLQVKAPFDGILNGDTAELGAFLSVGAPCANIIALDGVKLVAYLSADKVDSIKLGNTVYAQIAGYELPQQGVVKSISASADPVTGTYRAEFEPLEPLKDVRDGANIQIFVALDGQKGHQIPANALTLNTEGIIGVMLFEDGLAKFSPVNVERDTPNGVWISGLEGKISLIVQGQEYASDGRAIEAIVTSNPKAE